MIFKEYQDKLQAAVDASPFKGYMVVQCKVGGYHFTISDGVSDLMLRNRIKAYRDNFYRLSELRKELTKEVVRKYEDDLKKLFTKAATTLL